MGVIARQSLKTSIVNFAGAAIGIFSVLFIYPSHVTNVGVGSNIFNLASLFSPLMALGVGAASVKFFSDFQQQGNKTKGYLPFLILMAVLNTLVLLMVFFFFKNGFFSLLEGSGFNSQIISDFEIHILILAFCFAILGVLNGYISNYGLITWPNIFFNLGYKIFFPLLILSIVFWDFDYRTLATGIVAYFVFIVVLDILYLRHIGKLDLSFRNIRSVAKKWKSIYSFAFYSGLTSLGSLVALRVDTVMVSGFLDYTLTGKYVLALTMAAMLDIPNNAVNGVAGPVISKAWKRNDPAEIEGIYKKAAVSLFLIGSLIFIGGFASFKHLGEISSNPESFDGLWPVFVTLAAAKVIDMSTSVNSMILSYSPKYKINLLFILSLAVLNIVLNFYFIPQNGIWGASLATFISLVTYNLLKLGFIWYQFKMAPFSIELVKSLGISLFTFLLVLLLPETESALTNILYKSVFIILVFGFLVIRLRVSDEISALYLRIRRFF